MPACRRALGALKRCKSIRNSARRAPGIDWGGPIFIAEGHARIDHQIVGKPQERPHSTVKRDPCLLWTRVQAISARQQRNRLKKATNVGPLRGSMVLFAGEG